MFNLKAVRNGLGYLRSHPSFLLQAAKDATRLQIDVPLDLLRWAVARMPKKGKLAGLEVYANPPALGVAATLDLFGTQMRVTADVGFDAVSARSDELRIELRIAELKISAPPNSPAAQMLGAMDLKRPGNLLGFLPKKPPGLVEARDDRFVFDLMRVPALAGNKGLKKALEVLQDVVHIKEVRTSGDLLTIGLGVQVGAVPGALAKLRAAY